MGGPNKFTKQLQGSYPSTGNQSVYSTVPAHWATYIYVQIICIR